MIQAAYDIINKEHDGLSSVKPQKKNMRIYNNITI